MYEFVYMSSSLGDLGSSLTEPQGVNIAELLHPYMQWERFCQPVLEESHHKWTDLQTVLQIHWLLVVGTLWYVRFANGGLGTWM